MTGRSGRAEQRWGRWCCFLILAFLLFSSLVFCFLSFSTCFPFYLSLEVQVKYTLPDSNVTHSCHVLYYKKMELWELTIKAAGLNPGNIGTLCEVGGGEQTILCLGCSSSESDSLCLQDVSVSSKIEWKRSVRTAANQHFQSGLPLSQTHLVEACRLANIMDAVLTWGVMGPPVWALPLGQACSQWAWRTCSNSPLTQICFWFLCTAVKERSGALCTDT